MCMIMKNMLYNCHKENEIRSLPHHRMLENYDVDRVHEKANEKVKQVNNNSFKSPKLREGKRDYVRC